MYNVDHIASDTTSCEILKNKIKRFIDNTDYSIKPTVPTLKPVLPSRLPTRITRKLLYHHRYLYRITRKIIWRHVRHLQTTTTV